MTGPVLIISGICHRRHAACCLTKSLTRYNVHHCIIRFGRIGTERENLFKHGNQVAHMPLLSCVFLCDLYLQHLIGSLESTKQRMYRFPDLEIHRPVLDLQYHIVTKSAVKLYKIVIARSRPIGYVISPVLFAVIYKTAPDDKSSVRLHRLGQHIGAVRVRPSVSERPGTPFRISLDQKTAQIRDLPENKLHPPLPPFPHLFRQRICAVQLSQFHRSGIIQRQEELDPITGKNLG